MTASYIANRWILLVAVITLLSGIADGITIEVTIDRDAFSLESDVNGGVIVRTAKGTPPLQGKPHIEQTFIPILLPPGTKAARITILSDKTETLATDVKVAPIISHPLDDSFYEPANKSINTSDSTYPQKPVSLANTGNMMGFSYALISISPITYIYDSKTLLFHKRIVADIEIEQSYRTVPKISTDWADYFRRRIASNVFNNINSINGMSINVIANRVPLIDDYSLSESVLTLREFSWDSRHFPPTSGDDPVDLLVITSNELISSAQQYLDETQNGFVTHFASIEQILESYSGSDDAERLRKFIKDAYINWGVLAVVLAGDHTQLPIRNITEIDIGGLWAESPSDIYFAALDGNMNSDYDDEFGESAEDDIAPDVMFSRLQVRNSFEIHSFAQKFESYRFNHPIDFFGKILFIGSCIHSSCADNTGSNRKNMILAATGLDTLFEVTKMYCRPEEIDGDVEISSDNYRLLLQEGYAIQNHFDHGNQIYISFGMYCGDGGLSLADIADLENSLFPVFYTFSCDVNRLDTDNIAREWVINPDGGGIAMFAHSNTAWSSQAYMDDRMWEAFTEEKPIFCGELYNEWIMRLLANPYDVSILNLSGHPLTPIAPYPPVDIDISYEPPNISSSDTLLFVSLSPPPEHSVLLSIASRNKVLCRVLVDSTDAVLTFRLCGEDTVWLTLHTLPMQRIVIPVSSASNSHIAVADAELTEIWGDFDGVAEAGELVCLKAHLINDGSVASTETVSVNIPDMAFSDTFIAPVSPNDTFEYISENFPFLYLSDSLPCPASVPVYFSSNSFSDTLPVTVAGAYIEPLFWQYTDSVDNIPEPGDTGFCEITFRNNTFGNIAHFWAQFSSEHLIFLSDSVPVPNMHTESLCTIYSPCVILDTNFEYSVLMRNPLFEFSWDFVLNRPSPPESVWTLPEVGKISIFWLASPGISNYLVFRSNYDSDYRLLTPFPIHNSFYVDNSVEPLQQYYYRIVSIDSFYNISSFSPTATGWAVLPYLAGFPVNLPLGVWVNCAALAFDADGDGCKEIYIPDIDGHISGFHCDGSEIIDTTEFLDVILSDERTTMRGFWSSPAAADIDNDGTMEIVAADRTYPSKIWAIDGFGNVKPGFPLSINDRILQDLVLADLDGDSLYEIIIFSEYKNLYILRYDGTPYTGDSILVDNLPECTGSFGASAPAVGDIDGDGNPEIIVGGGIDAENNGYIYVWQSDGTRREGFPITVPGDPRGSPVIGNFDSDTTTLEFALFVVGIGLYAFYNTGEIMPGFPVPITEIGYCDGIRSAALADFNNDNICEIVFQTDEKLSVINYDGTMCSGFPVDIGNVQWSCPVVADLDDDGALEILAPNDYQLVAYEFSGEPISAGYPLPCGINIMSTPIIDDIDGDGSLEIAVPAHDSRLYIWRTFATMDTSLMPWPQHRGNMRRTATLKPTSNVSITQHSKPKFAGLSAYPNPFNSSCLLNISTPSQGTLDIYNILGKLVSHRQLKPGNHTIRWNGIDGSGAKLPSGIYIMMLKCNNSVESHPIFIIR